MENGSTMNRGKNVSCIAVGELMIELVREAVANGRIHQAGIRLPPFSKLCLICAFLVGSVIAVVGLVADADAAQDAVSDRLRQWTARSSAFPFNDELRLLAAD